MRKNLEIEQKYNARSIPLDSFKDFCIKKGPNRVIVASGYDTFYSNTKDEASFFRYRERDGEWELTFKRELYKDDSVVRAEHNMPLKFPTSDSCQQFCKEMGYEYNTCIFKSVFVYVYDVHIICYYVVYDTNLVELGRFIEIELMENVDWKSEEYARASLESIEKGCKELGINQLNRVKPSLFQLFRVRS